MRMCHFYFLSNTAVCANVCLCEFVVPNTPVNLLGSQRTHATADKHIGRKLYLSSPQNGFATGSSAYVVLITDIVTIITVSEKEPQYVGYVNHSDSTS